jgi:hypothetical protein
MLVGAAEEEGGGRTERDGTSKILVQLEDAGIMDQLFFFFLFFSELNGVETTTRTQKRAYFPLYEVFCKCQC